MPRSHALTSAAFAAALAASGTSSAESLNWRLYDSSELIGGSTSTQMTFRARDGSTDAVINDVSKYLRVRAFYSAPANNSYGDKDVAGNPWDGSKSLTAGTIGLYSGSGLGVNSADFKMYKTPTGSYTDDECPAVANGNCTPEHTLDNWGNKEYLVFQLPSDNFDPSSVIAKAFGPTSDSDLTFFVGGTLGQFLTNGATEDTALGQFAGKKINDLGFTRYDNCTGSATPAAGRTVQVGNFGPDCTSPETGANTNLGRYLIVAGWLGDTTPEDHVKIKKISGTRVNPPPSNVPEPASIALLMSGLLGTMAWRRHQRRRTDPSAG